MFSYWFSSAGVVWAGMSAKKSGSKTYAVLAILCAVVGGPLWFWHLETEKKAVKQEALQRRLDFETRHRIEVEKIKRQGE